MDNPQNTAALSASSRRPLPSFHVYLGEHLAPFFRGRHGHFPQNGMGTVESERMSDRVVR